VISKVAAREPAACGVNVTVMVQLPSAGTLFPHVLVCVKSLGSAPVMVIALMLSVFPKFWRVTVWEAEDWPSSTVPKMREVGETFTEATPVPVSDAVV